MCLLRSALVCARIRKRIHNEVGPISKHMGIFHMVGMECWVVSQYLRKKFNNSGRSILVLATQIQRAGKISLWIHPNGGDEITQPGTNLHPSMKWMIKYRAWNEPWYVWQQHNTVWKWRRAKRSLASVGKLSISASATLPSYPFQPYGLPSQIPTTKTMSNGQILCRYDMHQWSKSPHVQSTQWRMCLHY